MKYYVKATDVNGCVWWLHCINEYTGPCYRPKPSVITNKAMAQKQIRLSDHNKYTKLEILNSEEFSSWKETWLKEMKLLCSIYGGVTHREGNHLYLYLEGYRFGRPIANWYEITDFNKAEITEWIKKYVIKEEPVYEQYHK